LEPGTEYGLNGEVCLLTEQDFIVRLKPETRAEPGNGSSSQRVVATIEGFGTASKAEKMGLRLSLALLWCAVSSKHHLRLEYHTPQPCVVFDRTARPDGLRISSSVTVTLTKGIQGIARLIDQALAKEVECDPRLLISMELFASSMLESTERARFIGLVSCLEPLASQESYENAELNGLINRLVAGVRELSLDCDTTESIVGRACGLRQQSISQSIVQLVQRYFPGNPTVAKAVKEAYGIRSKILHEGSFDADLTEKTKQLQDIIRWIYSRLIGLDLQVPANIDPGNSRG